jgi:hypothetical protein
MVLWMKARAGQPGYLSVVQSVDARADLVVAQLFNTFTDKRLLKWQRVWYDDHPDLKKRQPRPVATGDEWHEYRTPGRDAPALTKSRSHLRLVFRRTNRRARRSTRPGWLVRPAAVPCEVSWLNPRPLQFW